MEEEVKDARGTVKYLAGFSREVVEAAETAAAAAEEDLDRVVAAAVPA